MNTYEKTFSYEERCAQRADVPYGVNEISASRYNLIMCGSVFYGLLMNFLMVVLLGNSVIGYLSQHPMGIIVFFVAYLVLGICGVVIAHRSSRPAISFLGYNMIVLPLGILLCIVIPGYPIFIVAKAIALTAFITLFMTGLGTAFPQFFLSIGRTLLITLCIALLAEVLSLLLFGYSGTFFDIIFVLIFSLYVGFDIARSQVYAHTVDNAIDSAIDIYLDIVNLFLRLLQILARSKK